MNRIIGVLTSVFAIAAIASSPRASQDDAAVDEASLPTVRLGVIEPIAGDSDSPASPKESSATSGAAQRSSDTSAPNAAPSDMPQSANDRRRAVMAALRAKRDANLDRSATPTESPPAVKAVMPPTADLDAATAAKQARTKTFPKIKVPTLSQLSRKSDAPSSPTQAEQQPQPPIERPSTSAKKDQTITSSIAARLRNLRPDRNSAVPSRLTAPVIEAETPVEAPIDPEQVPFGIALVEHREPALDKDDMSVPESGANPGTEEDLEAAVDPQAWWQQQLVQPLREKSDPRRVQLDDLILGALRHSPKVRSISTTPLIRSTAIEESQGQFDWRTFMETRFTDTSEPVGSSLTTGGPNRLLDQNWRYNSGFRRKTETGAKFEVAQKVGLEDSNSRFFVPTDQANSKLALSFTQPLLNGAGRTYNTSLIVLAKIDSSVAHNEFSKQIQDHLLEVTRTYWDLYLQRAVLIQKRTLHQQAAEILAELEHRRAIDSLKSQIVRAKAAVAARHAEIVRAEMAIRNTESKLRALVNDPELLPNQQTELLPREVPGGIRIEPDLDVAIATAMENRPEIEAAASNVKAASVRLGISKKELLPVLDFVAEASAAGLVGDSSISKAYGNQFSEGRPTYSVGLMFEVPLCNREAKARHQRRQLELAQLQHEMQNTIEMLKAEVEVAVRQVSTSYREMQSKRDAMTASEEEVGYLHERWKLLPGEDQAASFVLDDLLTAQDRLAAEQFDFVAAQVAYTVSLSELKRANGTLLQAEQIDEVRTCVDGLPVLQLEKRPRQ